MLRYGGPAVPSVRLRFSNATASARDGLESPCDANTALNSFFEGIDVSNETQVYQTWMCLICGWVYDEAAGAPDDGIAPGTRWADVPMNWTCPECGARKDDFEMTAI
jgi:rubredoxin